MAVVIVAPMVEPAVVPIDGADEPSPTAPASTRNRLQQARDQAVAIDEAIYAAVATTETPDLDRAVARLSDAANFSMIWFAAAGALAVAGGPRGRRAAVDGVAAIGVASFVANQVLKRIARRDRPERSGAAGGEGVARHVRMPASTSFPSGHSASAFAFATAAAGRIAWLSPPLHALAAAVAYSRVHTGVHYPGDVVVGSLTGVMCGHLTSWVSHRVRP